MSQSRKRETEVESELGRISVSVLDDMAQFLQPKERLYSIGYQKLLSRLCTKLSYRDASEILNFSQHRDAYQTIKLRTLSDFVGRIGEGISNKLEETTERIRPKSTVRP